MSKKYQVINQLNQVLLENATTEQATRYARAYMQMYPGFTYQHGKFYVGKPKRKNLRLTIREQ